MLRKIYSVMITILFFVFVAFGVYFYFVVFRPLKFAVSELESENQSLMALLQSEREKCKKKELELSVTKPDTSETVPTEDTVSQDAFSLMLEGGNISIPVAMLFEDDSSTLSERGKELIKQAWDEINKAPFKELLVLIFQESDSKLNDVRAEQALAVKSYLVKLGAPQDKVWAWVRNDVDYGVLELRVKR